MASSFRSYAWFVLVLLGIAAGLMAIGMPVTRRLGGGGAVVGMLWGCGLSVLASAAGALPQLVGGGTPQQVGTLHLSSLAIRMGVTLFGVLAIVLATAVPRQPFLLWVAISYLVLLIADVYFVLTRERSS